MKKNIKHYYLKMKRCPFCFESNVNIREHYKTHKKCRIGLTNWRKFGYTAISLFSGMGGDTYGLRQAGIKVVGYCEYEKDIKTTHEKNFMGCKLIGKGNGNILEITDEEFAKFCGTDIIFAGFPCQGFSHAGKKMSDDPRNTLFREFVRATRIVNPKIIIGENVKGLLTRKTSSGENYIDIIVEEFSNIGYKVKYKVLNTVDFEITQKRERLIIIGIRENVIEDFNLKFPNPILKSNSIDDFIMRDDYDGMICVPQQLYDFKKNIPSENIITIDEQIEIKENSHPYLKTRIFPNEKERTYGGKKYECLVSFGKRISPIHCEIVDFTKPSKTIICSYGRQPRLFVPFIQRDKQYLRPFNPTELKQIQGFPKNFKIHGNRMSQITQIGNAVPPMLIYHVINTIIKTR